ncbi:MAG: ABC transporter substrate-binding protein [Verrucomicrobiota bacterium]
MAWTRLLLPGVTLVALAIGGWGAWQAAHTQRGSTGDVVMLLPGPLPRLNPFLPATESERQIIDLIHEPLIRIGRDGRLATALAEQWQWRQDMTCWFDSPASAREAAEELRGQPVEKRASWDLESVTTKGEALVVRFTRPGSAVAQEVQEAIAASAPQKLTFVRIVAPPSARPVLEEFARHAEHAGTTKRLWFDDDGTCEIGTTRTGIQTHQALADWFLARLLLAPETTPVGEVTALLEPVLDFRLKAARQWPDGSAISAADVRATLDLVLPRPWPLPGRDAFRQVQSITEPEPGLVRIIYRKAYSPALAAWTTLPILPASWLEKHQKEFETTSPPGAGSWQVSRHDPTRLWLEKHRTLSADEVTPRIQMLAATSPLQVRIGLATQSFDLAWPSEASRELLRAKPTLKIMPSPARHQIMLVWNTTASWVKDARVRRGLGLALDRQALGRAMPGGLGRPYDSFFPPGFWFSTDKEAAPADLDESLHQLSEAGWLRDVQGRLRRGTDEMRLRLVIPDGNTDRLRLAQALTKQWQQIGVHVDIAEVTTQSYFMELQSGRFDAALIGGELSPGWDILPFWHSSHGGGHGRNVSQMADPQLDLLLEALVSEFDPAQIPSRAAAVEARLHALQPAMPLFTDLSEMAVSEARFPGLPDLDTTRGVTLQELLPALTPANRPQVKLEMLSPK